MSQNWDKRSAILEYMHRWPLALVAFLLGCLVGLAVSFLFSTPHTAETTLFVAYNADAVFRNPDDYKNWQMGQLNALMVAPDVVEETHTRLKELDPYWETVTYDELMPSLGIHWKNTGTWRITVESDTPEHASQALQTWVDVFLETYNQASSAALNVEIIGDRVDTINNELFNTRSRMAELISIQESMRSESDSLSGSERDQPLDPLARWRLGSLAARASGFDPAWITLLTRFPAADASQVEYIDWLNRSIESLEVAAETLSDQLEDYESDLADFKAMQEDELNASRGLSSTVFVEKSTTSPPVTAPLRQTELVVLIGGLLGLIGWFIYGLVLISMKNPK